MKEERKVYIMKKSTFVAMILGTIGGILFALGMCMALIMEHKALIQVSGKTMGASLIGIVGALLLGVGMCLTMVWIHMVVGIIIGIIGIVVLL